MLFSHTCSSEFTKQKQHIFVPISFGVGHSQIQLNLSSCSRDMCPQSLSYFLCIFLLLVAKLFEITIICASLNGLP